MPELSMNVIYPPASTTITSTRTAAILAALCNAQQHLPDSTTVHDGYHFDTAVASLVVQYAYPPLAPCSLLAYRQLTASEWEQKTVRTADVYGMRDELHRMTAADQSTTEPTDDAQHDVCDDNDDGDVDETCRRSIRRLVRRLRQLSGEYPSGGWRYVACIEGQSTASTDRPTHHTRCPPHPPRPPSLSPPYIVYDVNDRGQHSLYELASEPHLHRWLTGSLRTWNGDHVSRYDETPVVDLLVDWWWARDGVQLRQGGGRDVTCLYYAAVRLDNAQGDDVSGNKAQGEAT